MGKEVGIFMLKSDEAPRDDLNSQSVNLIEAKKYLSQPDVNDEV